MSVPFEVTVTTSPTVLATLSYGDRCVIENTGAETVAISTDPNVTFPAGFELAAAAAGNPGGTYTITDVSQNGDTWYGITSTGATTVIVMID